MADITVNEVTAEVTMFGSTRTVTLVNYTGEATPDRFHSRGLVTVGKFPTGTKLHGSSLTLWKKEQSSGRTLPGNPVATINGAEYIGDTVLYQNNRNNGRLIAWNDDLANSGWIGH